MGNGLTITIIKRIKINHQDSEGESKSCFKQTDLNVTYILFRIMLKRYMALRNLINYISKF